MWIQNINLRENLILLLKILIILSHMAMKVFDIKWSCPVFLLSYKSCMAYRKRPSKFHFKHFYFQRKLSAVLLKIPQQKDFKYLAFSEILQSWCADSPCSQDLLGNQRFNLHSFPAEH